MNSFCGLQIVTIYPPHKRRRSWKARLLSRPWRPWVSHDLVEHPLWGCCKEAGKAFVLNNTIYVTPEQAKSLQSEINNIRVRKGQSAYNPLMF